MASRRCTNCVPSECRSCSELTTWQIHSTPLALTMPLRPSGRHHCRRSSSPRVGWIQLPRGLPRHWVWILRSLPLVLWLISEPLAQLLRFGQPRQAFRFRQGRGTGSDGCPGRLHGPGCGGMPQLVARRAPSAHGWPRRPLRGGVRGGRICRNGRCQMVSRISCSTVRASTPKNRWQATLACPRTRTCRAP